MLRVRMCCSSLTTSSASHRSVLNLVLLPKNVTRFSSSLSKALFTQFCKTRGLTTACIFSSVFLHAFELRHALPFAYFMILLSTLCSCCPYARQLPYMSGSWSALLHQDVQQLQLCFAGQLRGVCPVGSYSLCCGLPANSGY